MKRQRGVDHLRILGLACQGDDVLGVLERTGLIASPEPDQSTRVPHGGLHVVGLAGSHLVDEPVRAGERLVPTASEEVVDDDLGLQPALGAQTAEALGLAQAFLVPPKLRGSSPSSLSVEPRLM